MTLTQNWLQLKISAFCFSEPLRTLMQLEERGLTKTPLGSTAIVCAATDDVTAWSILAWVVAVARAKCLASAVLSIGLVVLFVFLMFFLITPRLPR
jgi:Kef-type K+ transport system membrane component KefB